MSARDRGGHNGVAKNITQDLATMSPFVVHLSRGNILEHVRMCVRMRSYQVASSVKLSHIGFGHESRRIYKPRDNKKMTPPTSSFDEIGSEQRGSAAVIERQQDMGIASDDSIDALRFRATGRDLIEIGLKLAHRMLVSHCGWALKTCGRRLVRHLVVHEGD
jgi:hypothetical protein